MAVSVNVDYISTVKYRTDCFADGSSTDYFIPERRYGIYSFPKGYHKVMDIDASASAEQIIEVGYCANQPDIYAPFYLYNAFVPNNPIICDRLFFEGGKLGDMSNTQISDVSYSTVRFQLPALWCDQTYSDPSTGMYKPRLASGNFYLINTLNFASYYYDQDGAFHPAMTMTGQRYIDGAYSSIGSYIWLSKYTALFSKYQIQLGTSAIWPYSGILKYLDESSEFINTEVGNILKSYKYGAIITYCGGQGISNDVPSMDRRTRGYNNGIIMCGYSNQILPGWRKGWYQLCISGIRMDHSSVVQIGDKMDIHYDWLDDFIGEVQFPTIFIPFLSQDEFDAAYAANYKWDDATIQQIDQYIN